jgi:hypothetical protein
MRPALVLPLHDPEGIFLPHLRTITPDLKQVFERALLSVSPRTLEKHSGSIDLIAADPFFRLSARAADGPVGDQFAALYAWAAADCPAEQMLHLCYIDRLAFALETGHRQACLADIRSTQEENTPLIFQRSEAAWQSHPQNYRKIEGFVTALGEILFGRSLDYAWCHLAIPAAQLGHILPSVKSHDLAMVAEMILAIQDRARTRTVDWLEWEDPFIYAKDPQVLKTEREQSPLETQKRLAYALPMMDALMQFSLAGKERN